MSPANTGPWFTPIRTPIERSGSTIRRSDSKRRSSSSPTARGAPADKISLPPSASTSEPRKHTPSSSTAACVSRTSRSSSPASTSGPSRSISASVPSKWMNPTATCRCSGSVTPASSESRVASGTLRISSSSGTSGRTAIVPGASPAGAPRKNTPSPFASPREEAGSSAAAIGLITISPASAVPSIDTTSVAAGPVTMSSRCESPTRNRSNAPACMPTDIRRLTRPPGVWIRPT